MAKGRLDSSHRDTYTRGGSYAKSILRINGIVSAPTFAVLHGICRLHHCAGPLSPLQAPLPPPPCHLLFAPTINVHGGTDHGVSFMVVWHTLLAPFPHVSNVLYAVSVYCSGEGARPACPHPTALRRSTHPRRSRWALHSPRPSEQAPCDTRASWRRDSPAPCRPVSRNQP